tara:strand:+ start:136 stop:732 length:597 start_codon:yes stop_codon:yes gene_type:complete
MTDFRRHAPATQRNREFIIKVLNGLLPPRGTVLEIASGTGQHVSYFASKLRGLQWLPTDLDRDALPSIDSWCEGAVNVAPAQRLDVCEPWPNLCVDALLNINMIHISPWQTCLGLFEGASQVIKPGGILYLYGPFKRGGQHTAASNALFDQSLRSSNASWGVRDLDNVAATAGQNGFHLEQIVEMPANNLSVVFRQRD